MIASWLAISAAAQEGQTSSARIDADEPLTLVVDRSAGRLTMDEFIYLRQAIDQAFQNYGYTGEVEVKRWGAGVDRGNQWLGVRVVQWRQWVPGEVHCRLYVTAHVGDEELDLGVLSGRRHGLATAVTTERHIEIYRGAARDAVSAVIEELVSAGWMPAAEAE